MSAYITLGKAGDVVSLCPILHADYCETGKKSKLIVAQEYAQIPQALDYVETVIYPGSWRDLDGAIKFAKQNFGVFYTPQMHGENFQPKRQHPSFQLDQWARCGRLDQWGKLPLVLPRTSYVVSENLIPSADLSYIVFADKSESSPFEHADDLAEALAVQFPSHRIVRLSNVQVPYLLDLLAIFDAADLIVSVDTVHLHLAQATTTPLIALVADKPSRWQGAAFHPKMSLHVRYGDYPLRKSELLHVANRCVNKLRTVQIKTVETGRKNGYNLSVLKVGDKLWQTYRWHPAESWRTELVLIRDGVEYPITPPAKYAKHSWEDGRLFWYRGIPHISMTIAKSHVIGQKFDPCICGYGKIGPEGHITDWVEPEHKDNVWTKQTKNIVFFEA